MKPYPACKDSGVEWLGKVPDGWKVQKLKHIAKVNLSNVDKKTNEGEDIVKLCNYVDVYYNDYITPDLDFMQATASPEQIDKFALREGDVIITKDSESWEDIAVPAYVPADLKGVICGYHLAHMRPNYLDINGEFLFWSLCAPQLNHQFRVEAHGITRFGLGKYCIDNSLILVPPINEQESIARFLDNRTRKIDTLIKNKQKIVELLKEERTAIINQAVIKGLNLDVPMKESGIEWLGEIPAHWGMKKLKFTDKVIMGQSPSSEDYNKNHSGLPFLQGNAEFGSLNPIPINWCETANKVALLGDVLLSVRAPIGAVNIADQEYGIGRGLCAIRANKSNNKYLYYLVICLNDELNSIGTGSTYTAISVDEVENIKFPFPPIEEQKSIVKYIEFETTKIDCTIAKIGKEIELLQEYRIALISEAVTGKIDVREEVI